MLQRLQKRNSVPAFETSKLHVPQIPNKGHVHHIFSNEAKFQNWLCQMPNVTMEDHTTMNNTINNVQQCTFTSSFYI